MGEQREAKKKQGFQEAAPRLRPQRKTCESENSRFQTDGTGVPRPGLPLFDVSLLNQQCCCSDLIHISDSFVPPFLKNKAKNSLFLFTGFAVAGRTCTVLDERWWWWCGVGAGGGVECWTFTCRNADWAEALFSSHLSSKIVMTSLKLYSGYYFSGSHSPKPFKPRLNHWR